MSSDRIHLKAPGNWINDPNGFIYFKGEYHLFYQYFPHAPRWGTMHWGHAVSKDLVSWEHKGIALFPTVYEDQNGCFSGSAIEHGGRMYIYYTGVHYNKPDPEDIHMCLDGAFDSSQLLISSGDGYTFDNFFGKRTVIPVLTDGSIGDRADTRDPKVWRGTDRWYMVVGSKTCDNRGKLLFYESDDLSDWRFVNSASKDSEFGSMWECPDYFETDGGKVLVMSPMGIQKGSRYYTDQAICFNVDFKEEGCVMDIPDTYQFLDYGLDLYAPQSTVDEEGRRVLVAWLRMPEAVDGDNGKWIGMYSIPRVVEVKNGHIYFQVHPNVDKMFTRRIDSAAEAEKAGYKVSAELSDGGLIDIGGYKIFRKGDRICTDRSEVFVKNEDYIMKCESPEVKEGHHLDIYVDPNMIEVFINNGEYVITNAVYNLGEEIHTEAVDKLEIFTIE